MILQICMKTMAYALVQFNRKPFEWFSSGWSNIHFKSEHIIIIIVSQLWHKRSTIHIHRTYSDSSSLKTFSLFSFWMLFQMVNSHWIPSLAILYSHLWIQCHIFHFPKSQRNLFVANSELWMLKLYAIRCNTIYYLIWLRYTRKWPIRLTTKCWSTFGYCLMSFTLFIWVLMFVFCIFQMHLLCSLKLKSQRIIIIIIYVTKCIVYRPNKRPYVVSPLSFKQSPQPLSNY